MFTGLLHRMIFRELVKIFLLSLVALTGILLLAGIFAEASRNGLSPTQIILILPMLIPSTLPYTLPATTLFATCVVYGRLAHDNEILAIKASGINVLRAVWPGILLGIIISLLTIGAYYRLIPRTYFILRNKFLNDVEEFLYGMLKRQGYIVHPKLNYEIYVNRVQGRKLIDAQFMRRDASGKHYDIILRAREAELMVQLSRKQVLVRMWNCRLISDEGNDAKGILAYKEMEVELPPDIVNPEKNRASDMTWQEMRRYRDKLLEEIHKYEIEIASHQAVLAMGKAPDNFGPHVRDLINKQRMKEQEIRDIQAEMHKRPSLAMGCLCFVLVGCPVGIWFSRSDYLSAFITCFLPIVLLYYPLMLCGYNMGRLGTLHPLLSIWGADLVMVAIAGLMYRRLLRN